MLTHALSRPAPLSAIAMLLLGTLLPALSVGAQEPLAPDAPALAAPADVRVQAPSIVHKVRAANERMELIINTSRILTMDQKIPQAQVNNPDILDVVPLSPTQVQISAKKPGVTAVNLWGEDKRIYTVDVRVIPDARELAAILRAEFPKTTLNVVPVGNSVMISGYVEQPETIGLIMRIAEEYYPKVINRLTVSGVQQVMLHVRVMEVSRTKLRTLGFDFVSISNGTTIMSGISGLLAAAAGGATAGAAGGTFQFTINGDNGSFFGVLDAMRRDNLMKVLAEPNLVTISGRPATVQAGGEYGYQLNGGITGPSVEFKEYGTRVDMVPIVLGNGRIRLEVRPSVSEIDRANSVAGIPALRTRFVDTGVELRAGQTFAIAGLVQTRIEAENKGLPWISEVPYLGAAFRRVEEKTNEVELLIMVTPELVEPMDTCQVPPCGPGLNTDSPGDWDLYMKGHLEVPKCCPSCEGEGCAECAGGEVAAVPPAASPAMTQARAASRPAGAPSRNPQTSLNPNRTAAVATPAGKNGEPAFIGPIGYDVLN